MLRLGLRPVLTAVTDGNVCWTVSDSIVTYRQLFISILSILHSFFILNTITIELGLCGHISDYISINRIHECNEFFIQLFFLCTKQQTKIKINVQSFTFWGHFGSSLMDCPLFGIEITAYNWRTYNIVNDKLFVLIVNDNRLLNFLMNDIII